ncbi:expressed unknown protein [Seminavis robusta]|uniref:Uncharacterized protein n=1 Tax=Seminavis robusta TaxID=568900 RepID=A0A9N8E6V6_9STRA|nr:expressed unknown protein [Seminavis robusta]|eukprot:Sro685_g186970.1 n/a (173) ;mRNA; f:47377-47895
MSTKRTRIKVPTRMVEGGFEFKFETDSYDVPLHGILSPQDYTSVIDRINQKIKPARSNAIDKGLLAAGPLLVPLAFWGARHSLQSRKRKRLLNEAIREFNESHPELYMRWNRGGPESFLTIERRPAEAASPAVPPAAMGGPMVPYPAAAGSNSNSGNMMGGNMMVAEAKLVV